MPPKGDFAFSGVPIDCLAFTPQPQSELLGIIQGL